MSDEPGVSDEPNVSDEHFDLPDLGKLSSRAPSTHPPRILLLYGSLRERSYSRLLTEEAAGTCVAPGRAAGAPCQPVTLACDPGLTCSVTAGAGQCQRAVAASGSCDLRYGSTRCEGGGCVREGVTTAACRDDAAEVEPNDAPATGTMVAAAGASVTGALTGTDTRDCIRVTVPAGGSMVAETWTGDARVCALGGGDPTLAVFGPSGAEIVRDDDTPGRGLCSTFAPWTFPHASGLPAGTYAVCVGRGGDPVPRYRLTVSVLP